MIGFGADGVRMASTALAFPEGQVDVINPMPVNCVASVAKDRMSVFPFVPPSGRVADVFPYPRGCEAMLTEIAEGNGKTLQDLKNVTSPLWPSTSAPQKDMMVYEILRSLHADDRVRFERSEIEGAAGTTASRVLIFPVAPP